MSVDLKHPDIEVSLGINLQRVQDILGAARTSVLENGHQSPQSSELDDQIGRLQEELADGEISDRVVQLSQLATDTAIAAFGVDDAVSVTLVVSYVFLLASSSSRPYRWPRGNRSGASSARRSW